MRSENACSPATQVKNLLELSNEQTVDLIVQSVSTWGWDNCPWSEDGLSTRKVYPGQHFKTVGSRKWTQRQVVTKESSNLMFRYIINKWLKTPQALRRKFTRQYLESRAELAAVVILVCFEPPIIIAAIQDHRQSCRQTCQESSNNG